MLGRVAADFAPYVTSSASSASAGRKRLPAWGVPASIRATAPSTVRMHAFNRVFPQFVMPRLAHGALSQGHHLRHHPPLLVANSRYLYLAGWGVAVGLRRILPPHVRREDRR